MLFVGSCFAGEMGKRFADERFPVVVNPQGVMYNPASILHTVQRLEGRPFDTAVLTLGTNHVYVEKATGAIVDNCMKRPQRLFDEQQLSVEACAALLCSAIDLLRRANPAVKIILTVSPIRYRKYGFHGSRLSKATLLLAAEQVISQEQKAAASADEVGNAAAAASPAYYFPAYELMDDELRDYRFYKPDMLHPSDQAADYIFQRFVETCFSPEAKQYLEAYRPVKEALGHRPVHPESPEYRDFIAQARARLAALANQYPGMTRSETEL